MNSSTTRKRRAYCQEDDDPAESISQVLSPPPLTNPGLRTTSLPAHQSYISESIASTSVTLTIPLPRLLNLGSTANQDYILEQTAIALNVPLPRLLAFGPSQTRQRPKRPRLNSDIPMSSPMSSSPVSQDLQHESPILDLPQVGSDGGGYAGFVHETPVSGWTSSRLAECLSSFAMCPPCSSYESQPSYQPIPTTTTPYQDYHNGGQAMTQTSVPMHNRGRDSFASQTTTNPAGLFACDDPSMVAYLQNYTPLQPSRILGIQPSTSGEEMLYPESLSRSQYMNNAEPSHATGLGIQSTDQLMDPLDTNRAMTTALTSDLTSPPLTRQAYGGFPARYDVPHGYGDPDSLMASGSDILGMQGSSDFGVAYNPHLRTPSARRGPFKDHEKREKTAHTRRIGSCIRCRMQRIRCNLDPENEEGPCLTCKKVATNRVWRLSCLRWKITDVRLFKPGQVKGLEWTNRWKDSVVDDIGSWAASDTKTIRVTEGYTGHFIELRVRKFHPQKGDSLSRSWVNKGGFRRSVPIPPWAIVDMEAAKSAFDNYIKKGLVECCKRLLGPREMLLWRTYAVAMKLTGDTSTEDKEKELLNNTLDLWMSVRLTTKSFEIVGDETLGMSYNLVDDSDSPLYRKIPLPPVMGAQIDSVLIHQIQPGLRRKTLEDLQKMTQEKKQKTWLTTYVVTFILLHNIALITKHDAEYAKKHGMKSRFAREDKVKEYNLGANTLLAYFHYCNKGIYPFSDECRDQDLQTLASLDDWAIGFVHESRRYAAEHKRQWEEIWENDDYLNEYYYVSQLFETNWQPRVMA